VGSLNPLQGVLTVHHRFVHTSEWLFFRWLLLGSCLSLRLGGLLVWLLSLQRAAPIYRPRFISQRFSALFCLLRCCGLATRHIPSF
jgi:hypothetical protein